MLQLKLKFVGKNYKNIGDTALKDHVIKKVTETGTAVAKVGVVS